MSRRSSSNADQSAYARRRVGDRAEVERAHAEAVARADREVLVIEEQRDALVVGYHGGQRGTLPPVRRIP
jgi:hypothetical protein